MKAAKVCVLLSWYDESPRWLAATIASLAGTADHVVAVDGAYALFPDATGSSPVEQQTAIVAACAKAGISLTLHVPSSPWDGDQIEKRNATLDLARATVATDPSWWLLVVDGDTVVKSHSGRLREALTGSQCDVAEIGLSERRDIRRDPRAARAARLGTPSQQETHRFRWLYRADASLRYDGTHFFVRTDAGVLVGCQGPELLPAEDVSSDLMLEHRNRFRDPDRAQRSLDYYAIRGRLGVERLPDVRQLSSTTTS